MYILNISDPKAEELALAGGKGASLARLSRLAAANVPGGFIITTKFFREYILPSAKAAGADIKQAVSGIVLPEEARELIAAGCAELGGGAAAVRSSATAEDLPDASFAGQQDTFLNVRGTENVIRAVLDCFASLYNERAISYRRKNSFDENDVSMAVVVQKMVDAEAAGVMFTADPITSDRMTVTIEAVKGLGEELVSGRKIPASYRVKHGAIERIGGGDEDTLTREQILRLTETGKEIEREYGCPQDIEWAFKDGEFHILQSRAVTTLYPLPPSHDGFKRCFISIGHIQVMTETILPLGKSFWGFLSNDVGIYHVGGRLYMEVTHNLTSRLIRALLRQKLSSGDALMNDAVNQVLARKDYIKSIPKGKASSFAIPKTVIPSLLAGWRDYRKNDVSVIEHYDRRMEEGVAETEEALSKLSGRAVIEFILGDMKKLYQNLLDPEGLGPVVFAFYLTRHIDRVGRELLGREGISADVSKWLYVNITSAMGVSVSRIADAAQDFPEMVRYLETAGDDFSLARLRELPGGEAAAKQWEVFFSKYGMRCPGEIDITKPRFIEEPSKILSAVLADLKLPGGHAERKFAQGKKESDEAVNALVAAAREKRGVGKAKKLERRLSFYRNFLGLRESPKYYWMRRFWVYKKAILREAEKLAATGGLRRADDVYYLDLEELPGLFDGSFTPDYAKIDALRRDYARWAALTPPRFIFSDGEVVTGKYKREVPKDALPGLAVSNGVTEGRARVVLDIKNASVLEKGDILVTKFTDPSWTPAFMSIGGLVTEIGGMATHGAVVTREYGLPCVVGVENATRLIKDGQRVRLNGDGGYVELL